MRKPKKRWSVIDFLQKINPETKKFLVFAVACLLLKLALTSWRSIYAIPNGLSDDGLMQNTAMSMLEFHWFGGFNAFTLCKRNVFSFYLALVNALGIPLLVANELLYFVAILVIVFLIKKYTNKKWPLYAAFLALFFNPATFATATSVRIYRDAVYPAVILITMGSLFHLITNIKKTKSTKGWFVTFVASLTVFWYMREESMWIVPILLGGGLVAVWLIKKNEKIKEKKKTIVSLILVPIIAVVAMGLVFRTINLALYGSFVVTEDQSAAYQNFYGEMGKISSSERTDTIDFPADVRSKMYEVSPTFATIKDELENEFIPKLKAFGDNPDEINAGWTTWAMRQAMTAKGYYRTAKEANNFYEQVAQDIKTACNEGKIECTNKKPGLMGTLMGNLPRLTEETLKNLRFVYRFDGTEVKQYYSETEPAALGEVSEVLTRENLLSQTTGIQEDAGSLTHFTRTDKIKIKILAGMRKVYTKLSPILFYVALVLYLGFGIKYLLPKRDGRKFYERPQFDLIVFGGASLVALLIRCLIVAYLNVSAFNATSDLYLYSGYSLMLVFEVFAFALAVPALRDIIEKKARKDDGKKK